MGWRQTWGQAGGVPALLSGVEPVEVTWTHQVTVESQLDLSYISCMLSVEGVGMLQLCMHN